MNMQELQISIVADNILKVGALKRLPTLFIENTKNNGNARANFRHCFRRLPKE